MDWFTLTIILSFIASTLVLSMRAITRETNPFLFMSIVTGLAAIVLVIFCNIKHISLDIDAHALKLAIMAGFSVTFLDLAFIFMFRKGATVAVSMQIFRVTSIVVSATIGFLLFQEQLNITKIAGIFVACIAVYLLNSKPKGEQI
jgi:drug/metabolite transporter (DMT)-like permease